MTRYSKYSEGELVDYIRRAILAGKFKPRQHLVEEELSMQYNVSRTPIREALRRLEQERLIEDTGKGSRVLGITEEDLLDIMTIRERVEGVAAYYAAKNITPEGQKELAHLVDLQEFYFQKRDADRLRQVDDQFHDAICYLSRRNVIIDTVIPLMRKTRRYRRLAMDDWERVPKTKQEHFEIYQAIAAGNGELAEELINRHISNAKIHMLEGMKKNG